MGKKRLKLLTEDLFIQSRRPALQVCGIFENGAMGICHIMVGIAIV